ncbi:MAG: ion transporter [Proteobacteria bacterium]|nr:ion transporter [Pseudomonadota bacterium]
MSPEIKSESHSKWRLRIHEIIFEADTPAGKAFDVLLIGSIILSVIVVMLDSVSEIRGNYGPLLHNIEWFFTILFTIEYILRLVCVGRPLRYVRSFYGVVDLLAILPTYSSFFFPASHYLTVIRVLRVLRVFRILKLAHYVGESRLLMQAMRASGRKILVFLIAIVTLVIIFGSLMYVIEGEENGFTSIPRSIYWAIVTMTTVGYGDISPKTNVGQAVASIIMIMGYGIIAVPTGIVTVGISQAYQQQKISTQACPECGVDGHDMDAKHCKFCGADLYPEGHRELI